MTDRGVIDFSEETPQVVSIHPWSAVDEIREHTGFEVRIPDAVATTPPVTADEQLALDAVDPARRRDLEIRSRIGESSEVTA